MHGRNGCNFTEIMDGLLRKEPITRLVFVFYLPAHTAIYSADLLDNGNRVGKKKKEPQTVLAKLLVRIITQRAKK